MPVFFVYTYLLRSKYAFRVFGAKLLVLHMSLSKARMARWFRRNILECLVAARLRMGKLPSAELLQKYQ